MSGLYAGMRSSFEIATAANEKKKKKKKKKFIYATLNIQSTDMLITCAT